MEGGSSASAASELASTCPLTQNVPPVPVMADEHEAQIARAERAALHYVIETLWQHPDLRQDTKDFVAAKREEEEELAEAPARATDDASDGWIVPGDTEMAVAPQTDAEAGPPAPPPGPPPQRPDRPQGPPQAYVWTDHSQWSDHWHCILCYKYATEWHLVSDKHRGRVKNWTLHLRR